MIITQQTGQLEDSIQVFFLPFYSQCLEFHAVVLLLLVNLWETVTHGLCWVQVIARETGVEAMSSGSLSDQSPQEKCVWLRPGQGGMQCVPWGEGSPARAESTLCLHPEPNPKGTAKEWDSEETGEHTLPGTQGRSSVGLFLFDALWWAKRVHLSHFPLWIFQYHELTLGMTRLATPLTESNLGC